MFKELFDERKAAQVAAYFLMRATGNLQVLKLMKLMYLAERLSFQQHGEGIVGDRLVSMPHGPVMSLTYSHMQGELESAPGGWDSWIADRAEHLLSLHPNKQAAQTKDLLALCEADVEVLEATWHKFGHLTGYQLRDYTHEHCPEWTDPDGSMVPMHPRDLFKALGFTTEQCDAYLSRMRDQAYISGLHAPSRA